MISRYMYVFRFLGEFAKIFTIFVFYHGVYPQIKILITNASSQKAKFLGHEVHILQEDSKHDLNGRRCINGNIGLRVPTKVIQEKCKKYMKNGKPIL